jgi:hypothetical protein
MQLKSELARLQAANQQLKRVINEQGNAIARTQKAVLDLDAPEPRRELVMR